MDDAIDFMDIKPITSHLYKIWGLSPDQLLSIEGVAEAVPTRGETCIIAISRDRAPEAVLAAIRAYTGMAATR